MSFFYLLYDRQNIGCTYSSRFRMLFLKHMNQWVLEMKEKAEKKREFRDDFVALNQEIAVLMIPEAMHKQTMEALRESEERHHLALIKEAENKRTMEALQEADGYHLAFKNGFDVIYLLDASLKISNVSPTVERTLGYKVEELINRPFHNRRFLTTATLKKAMEDTAHVLSGKRIFSSVYEFIARDGTKKLGEVNTLPVHNDGKVVGIISIARDITERLQLKEEISTLTKNLEELNIALKIVLRQIEENRIDLEKNIYSNIRESVLPYVDKLKNNISSAEQLSLLNVIDSNLNDIASSFLPNLKMQFNLTPREIEVANLVKEGKSTKEISAILNITPKAIAFHRINLRKKMGFKNKKSNLRSHLLSIL